MSPTLALFRRDLLIAGRSGGTSLTGALFFLVLCGVIPFGVGPDQQLIARIAPAILWVGMLLSSLLALDRLFQSDDEDGTLDLLIAAPTPLSALIAAKCVAHWLATGLPLLLITPLLAILLGLDMTRLPALLLSLLIGTPALTFLGAIGAALTVSLKRGSLLLSVLVLPLALPLLIFGVAAASSAGLGTGERAPFLFLAAFTLLTVSFSPLAAAAALRLTRS